MGRGQAQSQDVGRGKDAGRAGPGREAAGALPLPPLTVWQFGGDLTLVGVVTAGVLGNLVGSWIAYAVGYYARLDLLEKNRLIHLPSRYLKWADDWFERYGSATVFFARSNDFETTLVAMFSR